MEEGNISYEYGSILGYCTMHAGKNIAGVLKIELLFFLISFRFECSKTITWICTKKKIPMLFPNWKEEILKFDYVSQYFLKDTFKD